MHTFNTLFSLINPILKNNLNKEVDSFEIKGYRYNQLVLPEHSINSITELDNQEFCTAFETSDLGKMLSALISENMPENYSIDAYSFNKKTEITLYIKKHIGDNIIEDKISFNITHSKILFGIKTEGRFNLSKQEISVAKTIKFGTYSKIPSSLEEEDFMNMTPVEFIEFKIEDKKRREEEAKRYQIECNEKFEAELKSLNITFEQFNKLQSLKPYNYNPVK